MYCIECGKQNPEGAKFCAFCGKKLFTGELTQPAGGENAVTADAPAAQRSDNAVRADAPAAQRSDNAENAAAVPSAQAESVIKAETPSVQERSQTQNSVPERPQPARMQTAEPAGVQASYARPPRYKTLQPLAENPAQPEREWEKQAFAAAGNAQRESLPADDMQQPSIFEPADSGRSPSAFEPQGPAVTEQEPEDDIAAYEDEAPAPPFGEDGLLWKAPQPDDNWWGDDEPESAAEPEPAAEKKKFVFPWQRNKEENRVLTADGEEEMPARKPVISRRKRDTHIPERIVKQPEPEAAFEDEEHEDIFFMRPKKTRRAADEDTLDDAYVNSRVRSILFGIAFVLCLAAAVWLFATNSGQMFLAGFNLSTDAQAYRDLGDSARANNQIKRAAEAYYKALSLDPDDYETALLVGRTQQQIGEYDTAADAYYMCTQLMPTEKEPYEALVQLYEIQNAPEKAEYFRELGLIYAGVVIE